MFASLVDFDLHALLDELTEFPDEWLPERVDFDRLYVRQTIRDPGRAIRVHAMLHQLFDQVFEVRFARHINLHYDLLQPLFVPQDGVLVSASDLFIPSILTILLLVSCLTCNHTSLARELHRFSLH